MQKLSKGYFRDTDSMDKVARIKTISTEPVSSYGHSIRDIARYQNIPVSAFLPTPPWTCFPAIISTSTPRSTASP